MVRSTTAVSGNDWVVRTVSKEAAGTPTNMEQTENLVRKHKVLLNVKVNGVPQLAGQKDCDEFNEWIQERDVAVQQDTCHQAGTIHRKLTSHIGDIEDYELDQLAWLKVVKLWQVMERALPRSTIHTVLRDGAEMTARTGLIKNIGNGICMDTC